jgi:uncharacterized protein YbjT (DUF2867 family)
MAEQLHGSTAAPRRRVCVVGASGKLGQYMVAQLLETGTEVTCVCRAVSVSKLDRFKDRVTVFPGDTDDERVVAAAVAGCSGVLVVLVPWGVRQYSSRTATAVMRHAPPGARLVFSCGWHISRDGRDRYSLCFRCIIACLGCCAKAVRLAELSDQVTATNAIFASDTRWTVVRGSDLEEGPSQGLPVWSEHVGDPILASNITRRVDFARFMVHALDNDALVHVAPAIVSCASPSALAHAAAAGGARSADKKSD